MMNVRNTLHGLATETHGAEIAEAAAVLPLMFMVLLGIFWFGQAFSIYGAITRAAQDGARAGAAPYCTTCNSPNTASTNATAAVKSALRAANLDPSLIQSPTAPTIISCGTQLGTCPSNGVCVQLPIQLSNSTLGTTATCGIQVSFQYPFRFWLPFTSLNKQQIYLNASARMRVESQ